MNKPTDKVGLNEIMKRAQEMQKKLQDIQKQGPVRKVLPPRKKQIRKHKSFSYIYSRAKHQGIHDVVLGRPEAFWG